jgi:ribosomal protein S16
VTIDREKAQAWIAKGAQASNTVKKLIAKAPKPGA